ncbi:MAG TPA: DUF429 domain-containing protein [Acidimicrobiales bacterium]|nr:DUF429 domain-containing protein [Acidimicrobiales bacterium]
MATRSGRPGLAVGIDVAEEAKGLDLVALDDGRRIVATRGRLSVAEAAAEVASLSPDVVCIDSPSGWARRGRSRQSERELARLGFRCFATGPDPGDHPFYRWMRVGMRIFEALAPLYPLYRGGPAAGRAAEVFPHATAVVLACRPRSQGETKLRFRRLALQSHGVDQSALVSADRVDAALAALTGALALAGRCQALGDPEEGMVLLPDLVTDLDVAGRR